MKKWFSLLVILLVFMTGCTAEQPIPAPVKEQVTKESQENITKKEQEETTENPSEEESKVEEQPKEQSKEERKEEPKKEQQGNLTLIPAKVVDVVDGDTMKLAFDGREETIRLLLVDTPETVHPSKPVQPFGPEASSFAKKTLENKNVQFEIDISERDKYGRLLVYLYINGKMFNEMLIEKGLARVAYVYAPNTKYVDQFYAIQQKAQKNAVGIWSIENYASDEGFQDSVKEEEKQEQTNGCTIKGNISSLGEKIYHVPDGQYYEVTKPEEWFCTEKEAQDAGYRKSKR